MDLNYSGICRICLQIADNSFQPTHILNFVDEKPNLNLFYKKLYLCYPELDLHIDPKIIVCRDCMEILNINYRFIDQCHKIEQIIIKDLEIIDCISKFHLIKGYFNVKVKKTNIHDIENHLNINLETCDTDQLLDHNIFSFSHMCRTCLKLLNSPQAYFLHNELYLCCSEINLDIIPSWLCEICFKIVSKIFVFKKKFYEKTANMFHPTKIYINMKDEIKTEEIDLDDINTNLSKRAKTYTSPLQLINVLSKISTLNDLKKNQIYIQNLSTEKKLDLIEKVVIHKSEKLFKCTDCQYITKYKHTFKAHIFAHLGEKPYKCDECNFVTTRKSNLTRHIFTHKEAKPYRCSKCTFSSKYKHSLKVHLLIHAGTKNYKCLECNYATLYRSILSRHMRIHRVVRPFKCPQCKFSTKYRNALKTHMLRHTGEKPYKCLECKYTARQKPNLAMHMLIHKEFKEFQCEICTYSTKYKNGLKVHMFIHSDNKPFKCSVCEYSTTTKQTLDKHILLHA